MNTNTPVAALGGIDDLDNVFVVTGKSRQTEHLACELKVAQGAVVNCILCKVDADPVLVLMAGDMPCDALQIPRALNKSARSVERLSETEVQTLSGTGSDRLFPFKLCADIPALLDASLQRFENVYIVAGSPRCLLKTSYLELKGRTKALVSYALAPSHWRT